MQKIYILDDLELVIMVLQKPTVDMKDEYISFAKEWADSNEEIIPYSARLQDQSYEQWVAGLDIIENPKTCPANLVDASTYFLMHGKRIIGAINIRHRLNDYLFNYGGHIGYGIRPTERKKGYATKMLELALPVVKQLKIDKILITCDKSNTASAKTILSNMGVLENEVFEDNKLVQRYWIDLRNTQG